MLYYLKGRRPLNCPRVFSPFQSEIILSTLKVNKSSVRMRPRLAGGTGIRGQKPMKFFKNIRNIVNNVLVNETNNAINILITLALPQKCYVVHGLGRAQWHRNVSICRIKFQFFCTKLLIPKKNIKRNAVMQNHTTYRITRLKSRKIRCIQSITCDRNDINNVVYDWRPSLFNTTN